MRIAHLHYDIFILEGDKQLVENLEIQINEATKRTKKSSMVKGYSEVIETPCFDDLINDLKRQFEKEVKR